MFNRHNRDSREPNQATVVLCFCGENCELADVSYDWGSFGLNDYPCSLCMPCCSDYSDLTNHPVAFGYAFSQTLFHCFLLSEPKKSTHLHRAWTTISDYTIALHATKQDRRKLIGSNCGVKQWNSRGTTKVNTQPLSWFHNENLKEINSFNDLLMSLKGQIPPNLIRTLMIRIINVGEHITS